jgi:hypothetical protein
LSKVRWWGFGGTAPYELETKCQSQRSEQWAPAHCERSGIAQVVSLYHRDVTSSYVYIRLILVTMLAGKIQRTFFPIAVLPTVTIIFPQFTLVSLLWPNGFLLPNLFCVIELHRISL